MTPTAQMWLENPTDYKIYRELYNSMSMSRESTSLKKSSSDCLKLAKQWCSIWVKWCYFWTRPTAFSLSAEALICVVGNYSIYWLLTFSVTHVPNIMKMRQGFLELRLKMSEIFFRHSVDSLDHIFGRKQFVRLSSATLT